MIHFSKVKFQGMLKIQIRDKLKKVVNKLKLKKGSNKIINIQIQGIHKLVKKEFKIKEKNKIQKRYLINW